MILDIVFFKVMFAKIHGYHKYINSANCEL